jgi:hypothetical protein
LRPTHLKPRVWNSRGSAFRNEEGSKTASIFTQLMLSGQLKRNVVVQF